MACSGFATRREWLTSGVKLHMIGQAISYLAGILSEQKKQTAILERMAEQHSLLIQAMAEDAPEEPDAQPLTYMDGKPCR